MKTKVRFMVYNAYGIGGTVKTVFNFANYMQATGKFESEIISIRRTRETPMLPLNVGIKVIYLQDARRAAKYSEEDRILLDQPSKLIHAEEDLYAMFNAYTDKKMKKVFGEMHGGVLITTMPSFNMLSTQIVDSTVLKIGQEHKSYDDHTPGIQKMIRESYGQLDALTILTEKNRHIYERKIRGNVPIYVLGNGTQRRPYRVSLKNHIIVAAGRYAEQKGYDMLIRAFALIAREHSDWIIKIYGEGGLTDNYIKLIHEFNLENQIILEPGTDKMDEKLSEAAIHVCSSYYEPFGMVIIEGFAMGLPCISFACDGPREIITNGFDGIVVPKEDINALAMAMAKVMDDETYRMYLGKNAYETSKKYDIEVVGNNLNKIVETEKKNKETKTTTMHSNTEKETNFTEALKEEEISNEEIDYGELINMASEGRIGVRSLIKMLIAWFGYKVHMNK